MIINDAAFYRHSKHLYKKKQLTGRVYPKNKTDCIDTHSQMSWVLVCLVHLQFSEKEKQTTLFIN